jgi:hypothetical protein
MWRSTALAAGVALALCAGGRAAALSLTFGATKDTQIDSKDSTVNFGTWTTAAVGFTVGGPGRINDTLLQFDLSPLPSGAIERATLRMFIDTTTQDPLALAVTIAQLQSDFVEGDGTTGVTWDTQPGVFASPLASATMNTSPGDWFEVDVTALSVAALARSNHAQIGLRIAPTDAPLDASSVFTMRTKEFDDGEQRPQLVVAVRPATPAPALRGWAMLTAVGTLLLLGYRVLRRRHISA